MKSLQHSFIIVVLYIINPYLNFLCFGHQLIAKIALDNFNEKVKTKIQNYHRSDDLSVKDDFVSAACWMDEVRADGFKNMDLWHFTKLVYEPFGGSDQNYDVDAPSSYSVVKNAIKIIKRSKLETDFSELFAVRLLTHIIGDMHQPFHNINLYSSKFKQGDNGGNSIKVRQELDKVFLTYKLRVSNIQTEPGLMTDLHKLWDAALGQFPDHKPKRADVNDWAGYLQSVFSNEILESELNEDPLEWANDMLNLAGKIYKPYIKSEGKLPVIITTNQINENINDLFRLMVLAGKRIAYIINKYLKTDSKLDFQMKLKTIINKDYFEKNLDYVQDYDITNNKNKIIDRDDEQKISKIDYIDLDKEYYENQKYSDNLEKYKNNNLELNKLNKNKKLFDNKQQEYDVTWN